MARTTSKREQKRNATNAKLAEIESIKKELEELHSTTADAINEATELRRQLRNMDQDCEAAYEIEKEIRAIDERVVFNSNTILGLRDRLDELTS